MSTTLGVAGRRCAALEELLDEAESADSSREERPDEGWFDAFAMLLVDALAEADGESLAAATRRLPGLTARELSPESSGRLSMLTAFARWAEERRGLAAFPNMEPGSHPKKMLRLVADKPGISNEGIANALGVHETEVSRVGARLRRDGLAVAQRLGRENAWDATPKGRAFVKHTDVETVQITSTSKPDELDDGLVEAMVNAMLERSFELLAKAAQHLERAEATRQRSPVKRTYPMPIEVVVRSRDGSLTGSIEQIRGVVDTAVAAGAPTPDSGAGGWLPMDPASPKLQWHVPNEYFVQAVQSLEDFRSPPQNRRLVISEHKRGWAVSWSNGSKALRVFPNRRAAEVFAKRRAAEVGVPAPDEPLRA